MKLFINLPILLTDCLEVLLVERVDIQHGSFFTDLCRIWQHVLFLRVTVFEGILGEALDGFAEGRFFLLDVDVYERTTIPMFIYLYIFRFSFQS